MAIMRVEIICSKEFTSDEIKTALNEKYPDRVVFQTYLMGKITETIRKLFNRYFWTVMVILFVVYLVRENILAEGFDVNFFRYINNETKPILLGTMRVNTNNNNIAIWLENGNYGVISHQIGMNTVEQKAMVTNAQTPSCSWGF